MVWVIKLILAKYSPPRLSNSLSKEIKKEEKEKTYRNGRSADL